MEMSGEEREVQSAARSYTPTRRSSMPDILTNVAEITDRIAAARENLRELVEQAAAYSGAADEELMSQRIAEQGALLERLTKWRDELSKPEPKARRNEMSDSRVMKHMEVIGADGVHVGTIDRVENGRIRLAKADSGEGRHKGHHHFIDLKLVADIEGKKVRLSSVAAVAVTLEEERSGDPT
jgi:hypothetical protein